jgi:hypothetical protein
MFRCHACGWRGWGIETDHAQPSDDSGPTHASKVPDLAAIDHALDRSGKD